MGGSAGKGKAVLVVDDEPDLCDIICRMLSNNGFQVIVAYGTTDAIEKATAHPDPISLLVTDLRMPDGNGRDLAQTIRMSRPEIRVLYMSGLPTHSRALAALTEERANLLAKPFTLTELLAAVGQALEKPVG
jgi:two-component system, cell cycle sensor histidine kinase and response regulator CckA